MWQGEEIYSEMLGMRGLKSIVEWVRQELNVLRAEQGMPEIPYGLPLNHLSTLMTQFKSDDEGPEPE